MPVGSQSGRRTQKREKEQEEADHSRQGGSFNLGGLSR